MKMNTNKWFLEKIAKRDLWPIGEYKGRKNKIKMKCTIDGHEWEPIAGNIINGSGCPMCWKNRPVAIKKNRIVASFQDYSVIDVSTKAHPNSYMKIDSDVYDKIPGRISLDSAGYACFRRIKLYRVHTWLFPTNMNIDHINGDKLDNRLCNLRECTQQQNSRNCKVSKNSTTGITGLSFDKRLGMWASYIMIDRKKKHLGFFDNIDFAVGARQQAEIEFFGEYRRR